MAKSGVFVIILLFVGIFFFSLLGITMLSHANTPNPEIMPELAEQANESAAFRQPILLGWQAAAIGGIGLMVLIAAGMVIKRLGFRL